MARGQEAKEKIQATLFNVFPGTFLNGKEIRIPMMEGGERVEIKIALTCAKENISNDPVQDEPSAFVEAPKPVVKKPENIPISEEEATRIADLASLLGLSEL